MNNILLACAIMINIFLMKYISNKLKGNEIARYMLRTLSFLEIWCVAIFVQGLFCLKLPIRPILYEYIVYVGACFTPACFLQFALCSNDKNINMKKTRFLYIIPAISVLILWTNDFHNLFYEVYSTDFMQQEFGAYFNIHSIYSYGCMIIGMCILIVSSLKKSGFFSYQTMLITFATSVPLVVNILATYKIIPMSVYITPICFSGALILYSIAIVKYKALNIIPVAFRTIIDTMSDAFIVISDDGSIADTNKTFRDTFSELVIVDKDLNLFKMIDESKILDLEILKKYINETRKLGGIITKEYHICKGDFNKYFEVDIHPIKAKLGQNYVGTLLLFKDITQHKQDIKTIESKQDIIVKQGQLVSIGELAGGVAHDINTPISAIKTGLQMLKEMYTPRDETEKDLLFRMDNCADKIIKIVNSMRNQIRNLGSDEKINFKVSEVINDVRVIAYNEVQKNKCELIVNIEDDVSVNGTPTKLSQVFTNLIINSMQAYNGKGGKIEISVRKSPENKVMIQIRDYAGGIPDNIKESVFKNILTTKGTSGTGLGLYLAYSVIKGEFGGDIKFESITGEGTIFYITLDRV